MPEYHEVDGHTLVLHNGAGLERGTASLRAYLTMYEREGLVYRDNSAYHVGWTRDDDGS